MAEHRRHWILIPAAGESQRFRAEGLLTPKPLLRVRHEGRECTMLAHVVSRVPREFQVVVALRDPPISSRDWRGRVAVVGETSGQAETVLRALREIPDEDGVTTMDCDTLMEQDDVHELCALVGSEYSAAVAVAYDTADQQMSRVDYVPVPTLFVEKRSISPWGMISARSFSSAGVLREVLEEVVLEYASAGREPYLSEALNRYPGKKIAHVVTRWTDWGTPAKLRSSGALLCSA